jgi:hypothetical protein
MILNQTFLHKSLCIFSFKSIRVIKLLLFFFTEKVSQLRGLYLLPLPFQLFMNFILKLKILSYIMIAKYVLFRFLNYSKLPKLYITIFITYYRRTYFKKNTEMKSNLKLIHHSKRTECFKY